MPYRVEIEPFAGARLAAIQHRGDYQTIGNSFAKVQIWFAAHKLPITRSFGIYFDDPESIPEKDLRAEAGLVTDEDIGNAGAIRIVPIPAMLCASVLHKAPMPSWSAPIAISSATGSRQAATRPPISPASRNI